MRADIFKRGGFDAVACDTAVARLNINEPTRSIPALNYHVLLENYSIVSQRSAY